MFFNQKTLIWLCSCFTKVSFKIPYWRSDQSIYSGSGPSLQWTWEECHSRAKNHFLTLTLLRDFLNQVIFSWPSESKFAFLKEKKKKSFV